MVPIKLTIVAGFEIHLHCNVHKIRRTCQETTLVLVKAVTQDMASLSQITAHTEE